MIVANALEGGIARTELDADLQTPQSKNSSGAIRNTVWRACRGHAATVNVTSERYRNGSKVSRFESSSFFVLRFQICISTQSMRIF